MKNLFKTDTRYPKWLQNALGVTAILAQLLWITHAFTTFDNFKIPFIWTILASFWQSPVITLPLWPIWLSVFVVTAYYALWVYMACRWPWHRPGLSMWVIWAVASGMIVYALLANVFDFIDPYDRARVIRFFGKPITIFLPVLIMPLTLPFLLRHRADVALIPQAILWAAALVPCLCRLLEACRTCIMQNGLPGWAETSMDLFLPYTLLCAGPFLITCFGLSKLIQTNRFLTPEPTPQPPSPSSNSTAAPQTPPDAQTPAP